MIQHSDMTLDLTDEETAALLRELDGLIDADRYFLSPRIRILKAIRAKIRPEPVREPLPPPLRQRSRDDEPFAELSGRQAVPRLLGEISLAH
jgi:hypothetical protein